MFFQTYFYKTIKKKKNNENLEHTWVSTNVYEDLPQFAIHAGHDVDGDAIYLGRAHHNGENLPAKVIPNKRTAYVAWGGAEHVKHDVEILTGHHYGKRMRNENTAKSV